METKAVTFEDFRDQVEAIIGAASDLMKDLGHLLLEAKVKLSAARYDELEGYLKDRGFTKADQSAAISVAKGDLHPSLFYAGAKTAKILGLRSSDQKRLVSGEAFELVTATGDIIKKTWGEMTPDQRNQLLGSRGGHILAPHEQRKPGESGATSTTIHFTQVTYDGTTLVFNNGPRRGDIQIGYLSQMPRAVLEKLVRDVTDLLG